MVKNSKKKKKMSKDLCPVGKLHKTARIVKPVRVSVRRIYKDEIGQLWVKIFGRLWKFPEEIDY